MKRIYYILLTGLTMFSCSDKTSYWDENETYCKQLDQVDLKMLNMLETIRTNNKADKEFLRAFNNSQIYWTQYRHMQIKAVFPLSPNKYDFNVGECKCKLSRDLTSRRVDDLKKWTSTQEGDVNCLGTYKKN